MVRAWIVAVAVMGLVCGVAGGWTPDGGDVTAWVLGTDGGQEVRVGYTDLIPDIELALGGVHRDAPDDGVEKWAVRGYALAHALDAEMLASAIGNSIPLPDGNLYGGLFCQYTYDRHDEWSGGWVLGGLVDWPRGWQVVAEYQEVVWNTDDNEYPLFIGLRKVF